MSKSGLLDASGKAIEHAINSDVPGERTNRAAYCAHEGKMYVEKDQADRKGIYLFNKAIRELNREQNRDRLPESVKEHIGDIKYAMNIPELDLNLLRMVHPEARLDAPGPDRAKFFKQQVFLHPEWVIL